MSNNANQTNLRKLSFLGFRKDSAPNLSDGVNDPNVEVRLDDECAKVFAMENDVHERFDVAKLYESANSSQPRQYGESDYSLHRKRSYPHTHVPLKASRSMKRRITSPHITPNETPDETPTDIPSSPTSTAKVTSPTHSPSSTGSILQATDSDTLHLSPFTLNEDEDTGAISSESEYILSDPTGYRSPPDFSPDKKVQFINGTDKDDESKKDGKKHKKRHGHSKSRKYSLPENPSNRMQTGAERAGDSGRRISTQPEDLPLKDSDRDQLDSHRSDDPRALRRHRTSRPSVVHIGRRDGGVEQLQNSLMKKMFDHSPHEIFVQLDELFTGFDEREWKETARWIKYEEDVEEGVDRWGKPHVASLSFHSLLNLRRCLEDGLVNLDMEEKDLPAIAYRISEDLYKEDLIREEDKAHILRILLLRHRHVNEHHERGFRFSKKHSYTSLQNLHDMDRRKGSCPVNSHQVMKNGDHGIDSDGRLIQGDKSHAVDMKEEMYTASVEDMKKTSASILKRIPLGAQGTSVLVGEVDFLEQPAIAFIRLAEGVVIPSLIEVNIPVRFIFILLGPVGANLDYHEVGRSISTLMANQQFHNIAYEASNRKALLSAINEFLDDSIVLPPGDWERKALLPIEELKAKSEAIKRRKESALKTIPGEDTKALLAGGFGEKPPPYPNPLERTGRPFGGLINDLKRRYPHFKSDIFQGFNAQCIAASIFMYFASLSGAITFGGLMGGKTRNSVGISETLVATSFSGIVFAMFSGQPLVIVGSTGPLLLFDESLYQFCEANGIEYLTMRVYIGMWLAIIAIFVACLEGSVFVKLFTRFTQEIFASLISLFFIVESAMQLFITYGRHPLLADYCGGFDSLLAAGSGNNSTGNNSYGNDSYFDYEDGSGYNENVSSNVFSLHNASNTENISVASTLQRLVIEDAPVRVNQPNTALFCTILSLGTFAIAFCLLRFRNSKFLGRSARRALGDFGVPIAIIVMVFVDYMVPQTYTDKLIVPQGLSPSNPKERGWIINPAGTHQQFPFWIVFAAGIPAMLVYILLFMETHIAELIIDKPERKLKKGSGFHLDIVLLCLINVGCGFLGAPWMCAATVRSIAHVSAVTVMSRTHAPGEKPHITEVKEQRVSAFIVSLLVGLSVLMSSLLQLVPMSVLCGVFLYMGIASTNGIQFFERVRLLFMPTKHHPQAAYVRKVKTVKMHLFTIIQLTCLVTLWIIKSTKISLAFPFFLILMVPLRAQLKCMFSARELRALDGNQPDVADGDDDEPDFYVEAPLPG